MERALIEEAANRELIHSYATVIDGKFYYEQQAMFNMFLKGTEWMSEQSGWVSVEDELPSKEVYDWVLVRIVDANNKMELVPKIAELRSDGFWHPMDYNYKIGENFEDLLKVRVTHWHPIPPFTQK